MRLREYQTESVSDVRAAFADHRRVLLVSPTASGKTQIFSYISKGVADKKKRVLIMAHRRELLKQISDALTAWRVPHGLLLGGQIGLPRNNVVVASVFTLANRIKRFPPPDLIIGDEAHHFTIGSTWGKVVDAFPNARVLGVTATACRADGRGLGEMFDHLVLGPDVPTLTALGFLSPTEVYAPAKPDLTGVHIRRGDYVVAELEAAMKPTLTGSAVDHYRKYASHKRAVVFCVSINHAKLVAKQFRDAGYRAEHVDGEMDDALRDRTIAAFARGDVEVLTSCSLIAEGFDLPAVEVCILLRPTESLSLYLQMCGRAIRIAPGKTKTIILDHAGNTARHGFIDDPREWSLDGAVEKRSKSDASLSVRTCPVCFCCHRPAPVCPKCQHVYAIRSRKVAEVDGELVQMTEAVPADSGDDLERLFFIMRNVAKRKGWTDEAAAKWALNIVSSRLAQRLAKTRGVPDGTVNGLYETELDELRKRTVERAMSKERGAA